MKPRQILIPGFLLVMDVVLPLAGAWGLALVWWTVHGSLYAWSIAHRPILPCWACGGDGITKGDVIWPWSRGLCWRCGGKKGFVRLGVKVLQPGRTKRLASEIGLAGFEERHRRRRFIP
jgi:hypothetical protein